MFKIIRIHENGDITLIEEFDDYAKAQNEIKLLQYKHPEQAYEFITVCEV